jgi:hypothetical protein
MRAFIFHNHYNYAQHKASLKSKLHNNNNTHCKFTELLESKGTRYHNWMMHYATSRKFAGSIPDEVVGFFN